MQIELSLSFRLMEVSLRVIVCFLFCVVACGVHSTAEDVVITHNGNFSSGLEFWCTDGLFPLISGVSFQRNGVDIGGDGGGTLSYPLNQGNEGNFTCMHGGEPSLPITLAGVDIAHFPCKHNYNACIIVYVFSPYSCAFS